MKNLLYFCLVINLVCLTACGNPAQTEDQETYAHWVNPFIGTDFTGNTYPGAQAPHGMVQLSPDNGLPGWDRIAGYFYPDSTIAGFSHTHLSGTGAGDLYDISFLPVVLPYIEAEEPLGAHSKFTHKDESAHAGYYQVRFTDYDINVELTATPRCGVQRYTFPQGNAAILLNLRKALNWDATTDTYINKVDSVTIEGYRYSTGWARNQRVYFRTRFSRPIEKMKIDTSAIQKDGRRIGTSTNVRFDFNTRQNEQITLVTALSGVSLEGAARNLQAEATHNDFDRYHADALRLWNDELGKIDIQETDKDERVKFYTALYHSLLAPTIYGDVDGAYPGADAKVHQSDGWTNYSTFSLWDTYRTAHPLYTLIEPERAADMVRSLIVFGEQNGRLPVWNMWGGETDMMIGYHSVPVIADAYLKGLMKDDSAFNARRALDICLATANLDSYRGIGLYKKLGYVPYNIKDGDGEGWTLSKTLEYAFDDACIAELARYAGDNEQAAVFDKRAQHYRNVFNPATGFMQPRDDKGRFITPFSPDDYTEHICESNGWQYLWNVQHDVQGLIDLMGGSERFTAKLDSMMTYSPQADDELPIFSTGMIGQYVQGNEPSHHVAYLYNFVGQPHKTQQYVAQIMSELYKNEPAGLCGNEDCGQTSAWYVMSAMGFYPVNPVGGRYEIGTPRFAELTLHLPDGKQFKVSAPGVSRENIYVKSITLNGQPLDRYYITHEEIMQGGLLEFELTKNR